MTVLRQIYQNQLQKEPAINSNFKSLSPVGIFSDKGSIALTYNYYGGYFQKTDGTVELINDGSVQLVDNQTNYVYFNQTTNAVEVNQTGVITGNFPIAKAVTVNGQIDINNFFDLRIFALYASGTRSDLSVAIASSTQAGIIKVGSGLSIDSNGVLSSNNNYVLPQASSTVLGGVKVGSGLAVDANGVLSNSITNNNQLTNGAGFAVASTLAPVATSGKYSDLTGTPVAYSLPMASSTVLGGIKLGTGLSIDANGVVTVTGGTGSYSLPTASATILGGVKVGSGLAIDGSGVLSATGGSTSLSYLNDSRKLTTFWRPVRNYNSAYTSGSWGVSGSYGGNYAANGTASYTKYGKWLNYESANIATAATANSNYYIYCNNGNSFMRCGNGLRSITHNYLGAYINQTGTGTVYGTTNTLGFIGIANAGGSGTPLGTTVNDYSTMANDSFSVGWRPTDTNLQIFYKNTSAVLTVIDLGSGFPIPNENAATPNVAAYEIIFDDMATTTDVKVTVNRIDTGTSVVNTIKPYPFTLGTSRYSSVFQFKTTEAVAKGMAIGSFFNYVDFY